MFKKCLGLGYMGEVDCSGLLANAQSIEAWCTAPGKKDRDTSTCAAKIAEARAQYQNCMAQNTQTQVQQIQASAPPSPLSPVQSVAQSVVSALTSALPGSSSAPSGSQQGAQAGAQQKSYLLYYAIGAVALGGAAYLLLRKRKGR